MEGTNGSKEWYLPISKHCLHRTWIDVEKLYVSFMYYVEGMVWLCRSGRGKEEVEICREGRESGEIREKRDG